MPGSPYQYLSLLAILVLLWTTLGRFRDVRSPLVHGKEALKGEDSSDHLDAPALVVASQKADNVTWLADQRLDSWSKFVYAVDDDQAELKVPSQRGRESMVYLTYIIDHYDNLPAVSTFIHSGRYQWHNDDPDYDNLRLLSRLRTQHVREQGYVNLRCSWVLGCPVNVRPMEDEGGDRKTHIVYKKNHDAIFPGEPLPDIIAQACCAQFAVSASAIRFRPKEFYIRARDWLSESDVDDDVSGRLFEFSWHMVFGKEPVFCPTEKQCYCDVYGLCDVTCTPDGRCPEHYVLAKYSTLPAGWPHIGWDGESRALRWDSGLPD